jgi:hypothetical protein
LPASTRVTTNYDIPSKTAWIRIDNARPDDSSVYTLLAHNPAGDVRSDARLNVVPSSMPIDDTAFVPAEAFARIERPTGPTRSTLPAKTGVDDTSFVNPELFQQFEVPLRQTTNQNNFDDGVIQVPARILVPLKSIQAPESVTVVLEAFVEGSPIPTLNWLKDQTPLSESNRFITNYDLPSKRVTLTIKDVRENDTGVYTLLASNGPQVSVKIKIQTNMKMLSVNISYRLGSTFIGKTSNHWCTIDRSIVIHTFGCLSTIGTATESTIERACSSRRRSNIIYFSTGSFCSIRSNSTEPTSIE